VAGGGPDPPGQAAPEGSAWQTTFKEVAATSEGFAPHAPLITMVLALCGGSYWLGQVHVQAVETERRVREVALEAQRREQEVALETERRQREVALETQRREQEVALETERREREVALERERREREVQSGSGYAPGRCSPLESSGTVGSELKRWEASPEQTIACSPPFLQYRLFSSPPCILRWPSKKRRYRTSSGTWNSCST
jgi:hypothetical protein